MHTSRKLHDGSTLQKYFKKKNIDTKNNITIDISLTTHLATNKSNNHTYNISNLSNQRYYKKESIPSQCKQKEISVKRSL